MGLSLKKQKQINSDKILVLKAIHERTPVCDIVRTYNVPKSNILRWIKTWVKNGKLTTKEINTIKDLAKLKRNQGVNRGSIRNKKISDERHNKAMRNGFDRAKIDDNFRTICALYWGEGGKGRRDFAFSNSDVRMLKIVTNWLVENGYEYKVQIQFYSSKELSGDQIEQYWINNLSKLKNNNISKRQEYLEQGGLKRCPYGCVHINVSNALLWSEVMGGVEYLASPENPNFTKLIEQTTRHNGRTLYSIPRG